MLLLQNGKWNLEQILPNGYVDTITTARPKSGGHYGGSLWLNPARVSVEEYNYLSLSHKDVRSYGWMTRALPKDAYFMSGYDGQYVAVIPSLECVIVRLGFTADTGDKTPDNPLPAFSKPKFFGTIAKHCARLQKQRNTPR